jgi:KUP system potassium uptake protein
MWRWRAQLFLFLARNAMDAAAFFDIPSNQVIEVGIQLEL